VRLLTALERARLLPAGTTPAAAASRNMDSSLVQAVHAFVGRTPAKILTVQLEDVMGQVEQVNLPGTTDDRYPNWRRKLPLNLEDWPSDAQVSAVAAILREERGIKPSSQARAGGHEKDSRPPPMIVPRATYRMQFNRDFTFAHATALIPYLAALGVSHIYASPYLKARPGSLHGYDITDHNALNPEIGSEEDFERFVAALEQHRMGQLIDLVPNHMAVMEADNAWWLDVLENGPASRYAGYFDIDWEPLTEELRGKVLVPVLGKPYSAVLENGELKLTFDPTAGALSLFYDKHRFPVDPREYPRVLAPALERLETALGAAQPDCRDFQRAIEAMSRLPPRDEHTPERSAERARDKESRKRELAALCARSPDITRHVSESVQAINGKPGEPASFDRLHDLIEAQAYRLAHRSVASDDVN
jgi:(1->4)-alpha-D-glucan 1-alpha-D-glucosylmutase